VFRQLQDTGDVIFRYSSRESSERRKDILFYIISLILIITIIFFSKNIFLNRKRITIAVIILCIVSIFSGFALDAAIPLLALALFLYPKKKKAKTGF